MRIEIHFMRVYNTKFLLNYFFRSQSEKTLDELINRAVDDISIVLGAIDSYAEQNNYDIDDIEEMFYNESVEDIAKEIGIELEEEEEEEDEE